MASDAVLMVDGSIDFSGGVDSLKVTTVQSQQNPNGLGRNELAWLDNATVRDGGILQRTGWQYLTTIFDSSAVYQGGLMFEPDFGFPYLILIVNGHTFRVTLDPLTAAFDLSVNNFSGGGPTAFNPVNANTAHAFLCQGEQFAFIQAGDYGAGNTLPLVWNDLKQTLSRSKGITNPAVAPGTHGINELPAATAMDYYMGRIWYAQARTVSAGDIVFGPSGSATNNFRDAILEITENPLSVGGDGFAVPNNSGNIRCVFHNANLNSQLGQGQLFLGTRKAVHMLQVPVSRSDWINAGNVLPGGGSSATANPLMSVVQINNGPVSDRGLVKVNGDVFYSSLEPAIRSLFSAIRYFDQWGNIALSSNIERLLSFNDRGLMHDDNGAFFDNRLLFTALPVQKPQGIVHQALAVMDFLPLSTFGQNLQPVWEGMYEGLDILQLFTGDFGGLERCFALIVSRTDSSIQLWELTDFQRSDFQIPTATSDGETRVNWIVETPAYTWGNEFKLKQLETLELWIDKIYGEVIFKVEWRSDSDPCWRLWHEFKLCQPRDSCEAANVCYPLQQYREGFRATNRLPKPPLNCGSNTGRPAHIGYQHQLRFTIKGWCRIRGFRIYARLVEQPTFSNIVC